MPKVDNPCTAFILLFHSILQGPQVARIMPLGVGLKYTELFGQIQMVDMLVYPLIPKCGIVCPRVLHDTHSFETVTNVAQSVPHAQKTRTEQLMEFKFKTF